MTPRPLKTVDPGPRPDTTALLPLEEYDLVIASFSGGKDSVAVVLEMLEAGVPKSRIQLWHQSIDGRPRCLGGEEVEFSMDWAVTEAYCRAFAEAFDLRLLFSWKRGGFARELLRDNSRTAPTDYQCQDGSIRSTGGDRGKESTRLLFPQLSADLSVRWCSAYLKIDVASRAINGDPDLRGKKILYLSGERRQESAARSRYAEMERHRTSSGRRRTDHWRPVLDYTEERVWDLLRKYRVNPHPCYWLGYGRCSCQDCIFMDRNQAATNRLISPGRFETLCRVEAMTGKTIKRGMDLRQLADSGRPHAEAADGALVALATGHEYTQPIVLKPGEPWRLPPGAFKESGGPT